MSYPQTTPVQATYQGLDAWRLFTAIESSGDIYESNTSGVAFAIGSESDIARATLTYFDPTQSDKVTSQEVSVDRPAINRTDSKVTTRYATNQPARVLVSLRDVLPPANYRPPQANAAGADDSDLVNIFQPQLDLFQYLTPPSNVVAGRSARVYRIQVPALFDLDSAKPKAFYLFPFYGRKNFYLTAINNDTTATVATTIYGINFSFLLNTPASASQIKIAHQVVTLAGPSNLTPALTFSMGLDFSTPRFFDYVMVGLDPGTNNLPAQTCTFTMTIED